MARLVIEYDARNTVARGIVNSFTEMIKYFDFFKFHTITTSKSKENSINTPNASTLKSIEDAENGRVTMYKNFSDFKNKMNEI